jgi:hypothetical protein
MVELKPSKLMTRVRFPSPAPMFYVGPCGSVVEHSLGKGEVVSPILTMGTKFFNLLLILYR